MSLRGMRPAIVVDGPEHGRCYCPDWAPALWRARELKGAVTPWELWDAEPYPGLGRVVMELAGVLAAAENAAQQRYDKWRDKKRK